METLVLNKGFVPITIVSYQKAISLIVAGKVISVIDYKDKFCNSRKIKFPIPSVVKCIKSDYIPKNFTDVLPLNRKNLYFRDNGQCLYCGKKVPFSNFTIDHVVPKYLCGKFCWKNIVVCCSKCNNEKGRLLLSECNKKLIKQPYIPRISKAAPFHIVKKISTQVSDETWSEYIYWSLEREENE